MALYVTHGGSYQKEHLAATAEGNGRTNWTVGKNAGVGDRVVFYLKAPISAFVATGVVASRPEPETTGPWKGKFMADIKDVKMLSRDLLQGEVIEKFPTWGYMKMPIQSLAAPDEIVPDLVKLLNAATDLEDDGEDECDLELGAHVEFKSKTQRKPLTGMVKEIDETEETAVILRDGDLKKEHVRFSQIKGILV